MFRELFSHMAHTPLTILPLVSLGLFVTVFAAVVIRAMTRTRTEIEEAARLPLFKEDER